ncbi:MAG: glycoside hydrolase family 25 protein, partial [Bacteroidaceae bacterium]|nr:glycoside hydrolase family 25 protein [Bacteroidaceae bacterium]
PCEYDVHGIDISHYQGGIDWGELHKNKDTDFPLRFIFMKATEGGDLADATFVQNFDSAKAYGFVRGAYHFFNPSSDARKQAEFFIRNVQLKPGDLAPVLDVETKGKNKADLQRSVKTWLDVVEAHYGVKPILYTSYKFKENYLSDAAFDEYPYWIAHYYVDSVRYRGHWEFWQHTDIGEVPGIEGDVDLNVFNGTLQDLSNYTLPEVH